MRIAADPVCRDHAAPLDFLAAWVLDRVPVSIVVGPRGGGKSFLRAFATHLDSLNHAGHETVILGGSEAQSRQIFHAIRHLSVQVPDEDLTPEMTATVATYHATGSAVSYIAASSKSARGPHVPTLCLDEVDEVDPDIREAAFGMCMARGKVPASVAMTSTHHRLDGPMSALLERSRAGDFPSWTFCAFEVLERCPDSRSGPDLEHCPACPLVEWCHDGGPTPKAKRSDGHYAIDSLIQKTKAVSRRVFEADYLCRGPRADGLWFPTFHRGTHVGDDAEYVPGLPVHVWVDCGTSRYTGAVFAQLRHRPDGSAWLAVFADYLGVDTVSRANAEAIRDLAGARCRGLIDSVRLDPAAKQRTSVGPVVYAEYESVFGRRAVQPWPLRTVRDSIDLLDSFIRPASGTVDLRIHPRCEQAIRSLEAFRRRKVGGVYTDAPETEQHPAEDLVDAIKGGLCDLFPAGRIVRPEHSRVPASRLL